VIERLEEYTRKNRPNKCKAYEDVACFIPWKFFGRGKVVSGSVTHPEHDLNGLE